MASTSVIAPPCLLVGAMAVTSEILARLASLNLPTEAFQTVLSILADVQADDETRKAKQRNRKRRSRDSHGTVTGRERDNDVTVTTASRDPSPPSSPSPENEKSPPAPPSKEKQTPSLFSPPTISGDRSATRPAVEQAFEEFWREYPKRDGANPKQPAAKKFIAALKSGVEPAAIIAGARRYRAECDAKKLTGTPMVAQAITWLNQQRWADYAPAAEPKARGDPQPTAEQLATRRRLIEMGERMLNGDAEGNSESGDPGLVQAGDRSRPPA